MAWYLGYIVLADSIEIIIIRVESISTMYTRYNVIRSFRILSKYYNILLYYNKNLSIHTHTYTYILYGYIMLFLNTYYNLLISPNRVYSNKDKRKCDSADCKLQIVIINFHKIIFFTEEGKYISKQTATSKLYITIFCFILLKSTRSRFYSETVLYFQENVDKNVMTI